MDSSNSQAMRQKGAHMFGKGKPMRDGAQAQGRVIESGAENAFLYGPQAYHVKVRVEFDGEPAEIPGKIPGGPGKYDVGTALPIRYDQNDRSKIAIDEPALEAIADETRTKAREIKQKKADREISAGTRSGVGIGAATSSAIERKIELDKLHASGALSDAAYETELNSIKEE
ncbi:MAG TPA: DUF3592 domain-containing protein [Solirubrobacterales bacterium]|nr:DUF3592 domain-containing protein [Solirubrobacterales bacterium]